jgi:hypothetical protein
MKECFLFAKKGRKKEVKKITNSEKQEIFSEPRS